MAAIDWPKDEANVESAVHSVRRWALDRFEYVRDAQRWGESEHWETPSEILEDLAFAGGKVHGDCDAFAMLCRIALERMGHKCRLIQCLVETGEGHLVCECGGWLLDNRYAVPVTRGECERTGYRWLSMSGFATGEPWTEVRPAGGGE